jgi:hypothetical protein
MRRAERFLIDWLPVASRIVPGKFEREDSPLFPIEALREALANAFVHRDYASGSGSIGVALYDDRLEIISPGELHFGLTPEKLLLPHESKPWNPLIASAFYRRGITEKWGRGTLKIAELMIAAGQQAPLLVSDDEFVMVTFTRPDKYARGSIYVAGHRGLVGSAIVRRLQAAGHSQPAAAHARRTGPDRRRGPPPPSSMPSAGLRFPGRRQGGRHRANNSFPAEFIRDNLAIQTNVIHAALEKWWACGCCSWAAPASIPRTRRSP